MKTPCRLLVVDDDEKDRNRLRNLFQKDSYFTIIGEAINGMEAVRLCDELLPDLILMDVDMPFMGGLDALKMIKEKHPLIKVIMLSASDYVEDLFTAIQYGAQGYLLKNLDDDDLIQYLYGFVDGSSLPARKISGKIWRHMRVRDLFQEVSLPPLTRKEREILLLVAKGMTNSQISWQLSITENTVKNHIKNLLRKLELENRVQLAIFALKNLSSGK